MDACFKASKTLSGIETRFIQIDFSQLSSFKASKTLSGIETYPDVPSIGCLPKPSKPLKPFQGLKLQSAKRSQKGTQCFKASKTLSGIETFGTLAITSLIKGIASKPLKPFQGLKHQLSKLPKTCLGFKASKTLSGIETH